MSAARAAALITKSSHKYAMIFSFKNYFCFYTEPIYIPIYEIYNKRYKNLYKTNKKIILLHKIVEK